MASSAHFEELLVALGLFREERCMLVAFCCFEEYTTYGSWTEGSVIGILSLDDIGLDAPVIHVLVVV